MVERRIYLIRDEKVMLDADLAFFYGVKTKELNKAVSRNSLNFPPDFMFRLTPEEAANLRFQFGTSSWGGRRYTPFVFTELGIAMLSSVLKSRQAVLVNIAIMRIFQKLRRLLADHKELADQVAGHEQRLDKHDQDIASLMKIVPELSPSPEPPRRIGFSPG